MADGRPARIDFETRSACSLRAHGSWRYSLDPSTEVLCLGFRLPHWAEGQTGLWHPAFPALGIPALEDDLLNELLLWIIDDRLVEAHNAWFERGVWTNIMGPRYGWPSIKPHQWRCSAAKAAAHALPRSLDAADEALGLLVVKDTDGGKVMKKLSKPRKPKKAEIIAWQNQHGAGVCLTCKGRGKVRRQPCGVCEGVGKFPGSLTDVPAMPVLYHEKAEWFETLFEYCRQDVLAEEAISEDVPDLTPQETRVYLADQAMNERGFRLDRSGVEMAQSLLNQEQQRLNAEMVVITNGAVTKATQRARLTEWCLSYGVRVYDTQKTTIEALLEWRQLPNPVHRALTILQALGRSSTAKYEAMSKWICPDDRVHGGLLYHAATTGRWGGQGIQPQNFPKGTLDYWDMDLAWEILKTGDRGFVEAAFGSVMEPLSNALRGAIIAAPGNHLYVADYSAIEARVLLWLAEDEDALDIFRSGQDIYCDMAASVYGRPVTKADKAERSMGKVAILGLGYQMGASRFVDTCATYGITIDEAFAQEVVATYREKYRRVKALWQEQEFRAMQAVWNPGYIIPTGHVAWTQEGRYLYCQLPSGRRLAYPEPEVHKIKTEWGRREQLTFMGVNPTTRQWERQHTYGGMLVENITQAVARDILAEAVLRCADHPVFQPVLTVHDELIAEGEKGHDIAEFEALVSVVPRWAKGCPVKAEGFAAERYRK